LKRVTVLTSRCDSSIRRITAITPVYQGRRLEPGYD
jgi:hypothetical protein